MVPDFAQSSWQCVVPDPNTSSCPGQLNLQCPDNDIGHNFDSSMCGCNGELLVSGDCKEAFYCMSFFSNGGNHITCDNDNEIIEYDETNGAWGCTTNTDKCPGLGGFRFGCKGGDLPTPELQCVFDKNPFGTCQGCEGQIFISDDCQQSFYCSDYVAEADAEGCLLTCGDNERVRVDYATNTWECVTKEPDFTCPGQFSVDCNDNFDVQCNCGNELWMRGDCRMAFLCHNAQVNGENEGHTIICPTGTTIAIDFADVSNYTCVDNDNSCPGSFHFGCVGGDFTTTTTASSTPATTAGNNGCGIKESTSFFVILYWSYSLFQHLLS